MPLAPLLAGIIIGLLGNRIGVKVYRVGLFGQVVAFCVSLLTFHAVITCGAIDLSQLGFYIDRLAAVMMVTITFISTLISLFSIRYMQQERGVAWFRALLSLTTSVLLCMVSTSNLLMFFIFWQLLSGLVYLLFFNYSHTKTMEGASRPTLFCG